MTVTRFAPSPTGYLHLGHAYSALFAENAARREGGTFLLRIEDIDPGRCKPEFIPAIEEDLHWLGLAWPEPARRQSQHMEDYADALAKLRGQGVLYPCFCTRKEVAAEAAAAGHAPHASEFGPPYPGTCRNLSQAERDERLQKTGPANWRLDTGKALGITGKLHWHDRGKGTIEAKPQDLGDVVLARKDISTSYHLSVTVDDHLQGITLVTRGEDLFRSTDIHRLLQALLGYEVPDYHHHPLITDAAGQRYAKRDNASTLKKLREKGISAGEIREMIGINHR